MGEESAYKVEYLTGEEETTNWIAHGGKAKVTYDSGCIYEGEFNEEKQKHGQGKFTWMSQGEEDEEPKEIAVYEGSYQDGKRCGEGKMTFPSGDVYHGEWKDNKFNGTGTYKYKKSDDIYSGGFLDGQKDGKGVYEFSDASRLDGIWEKGNFSQGQWLFKNAGSYTGTFANGQPSGPGTFAFYNGITQQGEYKADVTPTEEDDVPPPRSWHGVSVYAN